MEEKEWYDAFYSELSRIGTRMEDLEMHFTDARVRKVRWMGFSPQQVAVMVDEAIARYKTGER